MADIVHGATGAQGSPILSALTSAGRTAIAAVRHPEAVPDGIVARQVDLASADSLASVYEGADGVFVHLPMGAPEAAAAQARAVVEAVAQARPGRVVISTSGQIVDQPGSPLQAAVDSPIMTLIDGVTGSGVPTAVVAPRLYLENLLLPVVLDPARQEGVLRYPLPASFPVSWSSHLDVADVVVRLLTDASPTTGTVGVGHRPGLTGPDLAAAFSSHLGREVRFEGITPEAFGELITPLFGLAAAPVVELYQALNAQDGNTIAEDSSAQELLGLRPRPIEQWLEDLAVS
ncbi:hydroxylase [Actinomyces johnsonii]|uniref:Hydroxylase n=2 Tax=Actinomyces johnsonii TaxID=544581 RepID=A0A507ZZS3_9ACTO|nr:NmrA family NAD(P)-binding protein [Actinomyces johnsonii]KAA8740317.1 NAD(P)H-binding protein [Actinomyces johnsonii]TQD42507.1 hydroxylase [Actinomyces johnsonii]